jgi:predicted ATPase
MTIHSLTFEDTEAGWKLEETSFQDVNLLVGVSGVGKTRILGTLFDIGRAASGAAGHLSCCAWTIRLETAAGSYLWSAEVQAPKADAPRVAGESEPRFVREEILRNDQEVLVERAENFKFEGRELPRLQESKSAVELLQSEPSIRPLRDELDRWLFFGLPQERSGAESMDFLLRNGERMQLSLDKLRQATDLSPVLKAYLLQEDHPEVFASVRETYSNIFPTVLDLRVASYEDLDAKSPVQDEYRWMTAGIREQGVAGWIVRKDMSAGMWKALTFIIELTLAPVGGVFLVDEIENSLGVNCLPDLAELLLERSHEVQLVMTSHHPQVINVITPEYWRVVTRRGSVVTVRPASQFPALETASPLQKFTQLINLPEYEEGVA